MVGASKSRQFSAQTETAPSRLQATSGESPRIRRSPDEEFLLLRSWATQVQPRLPRPKTPCGGALRATARSAGFLKVRRAASTIIPRPQPPSTGMPLGTIFKDQLWTRRGSKDFTSRAPPPLPPPQVGGGFLQAMCRARSTLGRLGWEYFHQEEESRVLFLVLQELLLHIRYLTGMATKSGWVISFTALEDQPITACCLQLQRTSRTPRSPRLKVSSSRKTTAIQAPRSSVTS